MVRSFWRRVWSFLIQPEEGNYLEPLPATLDVLAPQPTAMQLYELWRVRSVGGALSPDCLYRLEGASPLSAFAEAKRLAQGHGGGEYRLTKQDGSEVAVWNQAEPMPRPACAVRLDAGIEDGAALVVSGKMGA